MFLLPPLLFLLTILGEDIYIFIRLWRRKR